MALSFVSLNGCYYGHLASGQIRMLWQRQPLEEALEDPTHPESVRELLQLVGSVRAFASELGLRVDGQYTSYVDWPGDRVVTTLVRTRADSLEQVPWWFPVVGELPYKGFFDRARAEAEAARLRESGDYDVCVSGVTAYSTLGWLDDPVTRPMLQRGAARLVETLFHELVHATAFLPDEADFNEGVALFIGQQAAIEFFEREVPSMPDARETALPGAEIVRALIADRRRLDDVLIAFRDRIALLEGEPDRARRRARLEDEARREIAALPLRVLDSGELAANARLSDACLSLRGTYVRDLPRHERLLAALAGDLPAMIDRLRRWADESRPVDAFFSLPDRSQPADSAARRTPLGSAP